MRKTLIVSAVIMAGLFLMTTLGLAVVLSSHEPSVQAAAAAPGPEPGPAPTSSTTPPKAVPPTTVPPTTVLSDPPTTTTTPEAVAVVPRCETSMLSVALTDQDAAAGSVYYHIDFTNISPESCTLRGYPEVVFLDESGNQIGAPALRLAEDTTLVTVDPGSSAMATFSYRTVFVATSPGCQPTDSSRLQVVPPDETAVLLIPFDRQACANPEVDGSGMLGAITVRTTPARPLPTLPRPPTTIAPKPPTTTIPEADADLGRCATSMLSVALTDTEGAAGTVYSHLAFTNISVQPCTLAGYPAVTFVDDGGLSIGAPVSKVPGDARIVTLEPGSSAASVFALHNAYVATTDGCQPTQATGMLVFPPNASTYGFSVTSPSRVCSNPSTDGSGSITVVTATTAPTPPALTVPALNGVPQILGR